MERISNNEKDCLTFSSLRSFHFSRTKEYKSFVIYR